ncbi:MAG: response regulator transcription factor [Clostridia bacterium]|nr:response regulator transcription factor [Clostridia bacterium]
MYRIFLVEDDPIIAQTVQRHLESWGWQVKAAADFSNVMADFAAFDPQLVLLDIGLPFYNGFHWCGEIRKRSRVPVIFLSSASDNMNIVMAMHMGGDDFIPKPFDLAVLTAKVQALLRRTYEFSREQTELPLGGGALRLSDGVFVRGDARLELTRNEFRILEMLLENRGRIVSRDALMERLWSTDSFVDENTLSVNVNRLRKKLEEVGLFDAIRTRKGEGYLVESL